MNPDEMPLLNGPVPKSVKPDEMPHSNGPVANSVNPDEMPHSVTSELYLNCLQIVDTNLLTKWQTLQIKEAN